MPHTTLKRILYVEDDQALARLLQKRMARQGLVVETTGSAEDALLRLADDTFDLILIDQNLPGMSGLELLDRVHQSANPPPAVILTVGGDERIALQALEKGAADYAVKDINQTYLDLLPAIMTAAYTRERLQRENDHQRKELVLARDRAEAANAAKSRFLATMSHEIRTPMNVVTGLANALARSPLNEDQKKIVETLRSNADLLLKLINDLLDISRIEDGRIELESIAFAPAAVLDDIVAMFGQDVERKGLTLRIDDRTGGVTIRGDRTRLQQVLMNLVSNALKFTDQGEIAITASAEPQSGDLCRLSLSVSDTGIGIAPEKLPLIFEKFTQADETITRRFGGSGLGLSIVRSLVKMMGGKVEVESHPERGSAFHIGLDLPLEDAESLDALSATRPLAPRMETAPRILIVEDYAPNVMVLTLMLEELGYESDAAASGPEALRLFRDADRPYHAVLMDVQMQGMDGLETTGCLRAMEMGRRTPIIGVTAHALAGDRERCLAAGMDDYISKPVLPDILAQKLDLAGHLGQPKPAAHPA